MTAIDRILLATASIIGALGVVSAAAGSHAESRNLSSIAMIFLAHGPALLALALYGRSRMFNRIGLGLATGTLVFGADLAIREWLGHSLFQGAAPISGGVMILSWVALAIAAFVPQRR